MYYSEFWTAFLCENFVRRAVQLSEIQCPGCQDKLKSPLLHIHHQHSLLDKIRRNFEEIRGTLVQTIPELYAQIEARLPHSDDLTKDREMYISSARQFLLQITSDALYFGRYMSELLDPIIDEGFKTNKKRKPNQSAISKKKPLTADHRVSPITKPSH
jgi:hypothetical protein